MKGIDRTRWTFTYHLHIPANICHNANNNLLFCAVNVQSCVNTHLWRYYSEVYWVFANLASTTDRLLSLPWQWISHLAVWLLCPRSRCRCCVAWKSGRPPTAPGHSWRSAGSRRWPGPTKLTRPAGSCTCSTAGSCGGAAAARPRSRRCGLLLPSAPTPSRKKIEGLGNTVPNIHFIYNFCYSNSLTTIHLSSIPCAMFANAPMQHYTEHLNTLLSLDSSLVFFVNQCLGSVLTG